MRGISEKELKDRQDVARRIKDYVRSTLIDELISECKELNPWLPIENAPKDRRLLLHVGEPVIGWFNNIKNVWRSTDSNKLYPTHYQELPDDPKEQEHAKNSQTNSPSI